VQVHGFAPFWLGVALSAVSLFLLAAFLSLTISRAFGVRRRMRRLATHRALMLGRSFPLALAPLAGQAARTDTARNNVAQLSGAISRTASASQAFTQRVRVLAAYVEELLDSTVPGLRGINSAQP
jgi:hypothetical protein